MRTPYERLEEIAKEHFNSLSNLAKTLGLSTQHLYNYRTRNNIGEVTLEKLETVGISRDYVKYGKGEPLTDIYFKNKQRKTTNSESEDVGMSIVLYDLSAYTRLRTISNIDILPRTIVKIKLNIAVRGELIGFRVSGEIYSEYNIHDGNILIVETAVDAIPGQKIMYLQDNEIKIKMADQNIDESFIGTLRASIQYL